MREYFASLGLDIWDAWAFFKLLDVDGGGEARWKVLGAKEKNTCKGKAKTPASLERATAGNVCNLQG